MSEPARFELCEAPECDGIGRHFHEDAWREYWDGLSEDHRQLTRDIARLERRSLSSVACSWVTRRHQNVREVNA